MRTETMIRELRMVANKHVHDRVETCGTNITRMCEDVIPKLEKLKAYEDAEKEGRLLRLPCKVGGTVYVVGTKCLANLVPDEICEKNICIDCPYDEEYVVFEKKVTAEIMKCLMLEDNPIWKYGKTVFLFKEEAEKVLKQMGE